MKNKYNCSLRRPYRINNVVNTQKTVVQNHIWNLVLRKTKIVSSLSIWFLGKYNLVLLSIQV